MNFKSDFFVPADGYRSKFGNLYDVNAAIGMLRTIFEGELERDEPSRDDPRKRVGLGLKRATAPLVLPTGKGINDDLAGWQKKVTGSSPVAGDFEVPNSLAKWKRKKLAHMNFYPGKGIWTNMNAIRPDEDVLDNTHSIYVDQWDCEKVMNPQDRNLDYLYNIITEICAAIYRTQEKVQKRYPQLEGIEPRPVEFVTSDELLKMRCFKGMSPKQIEDKLAEDKKTVFIAKIGGGKWDVRAPDYDDYSLNGDLLIYSGILKRAVELLSGGIRVDAATLEKQLRGSGAWEERKDLEYHKAVLEGKYPQTVGWGIGQSRLCMLLLDMLHIGQVHSSVWDQKTMDTAKKHGVEFMT